MEEKIGEVSGRVWNFLEDKGEESVSSVVEGVNSPGTKVYMAIGWLAREGKLEFVDSGRGKNVRLR